MKARFQLMRVIGDLLREARDDLRFLDRDALAKLVQEGMSIVEGKPAEAVSYLTTTRIIGVLVEAGFLTRVQRDLYANRMARPDVHPNEAVTVMRPGAVVSLHTVLGEGGVTNNPSRVVYGIVPAGSSMAGAEREPSTPLGDFRFLVMQEDLLFAGAAEDRLDAAARYPRATRERALCDWIHFSTRVRRGQLPYPALDLDLSGFDMDRLARLAQAMDLQIQMDAFLEKHAAAQADASFSEQYSSDLGF